MNEPPQGRRRVLQKPLPGNVDDGGDDDAPAEDTRVKRVIRVKWGEEMFHPVQYNGFRIGDLELEVEVAAGQTVEEAYELVWDRLEKLAERQFERKLAGFMARLQSAAQSVRAQAASKKG